MPAAAPEPSALSRRAVMAGVTAGVAAGLAAGTLGGCASGSTSARASRRDATPEVSPDVAVAAAALQAITRTSGAVGRTARRHPQLKAGLAGLAALHAAHLRMLQDAVPARHRRDATAGPPPATVPHHPPAALAAVAHAERDLRAQLEGFAVRARSGEFARLLAAMSAAVGQQLAVLPR